MRNHVSTSAALLLAAVATAAAAAARDTPLDVRTSPSHFTGFSLLVAVLVAVPVLDGLQLLLHSRAVHSERILMGSLDSLAPGGSTAVGDRGELPHTLPPSVLLEERERTLRSYSALTTARAHTLEARVGSVLLDCVCTAGRAVTAAVRAEDRYNRCAPPPLRRALWALKKATAWSALLTLALGVVFGAPTEQDAYLSAQVAVFAAHWVIRACAIAFATSATGFLGLHSLAAVIYTQPGVAKVLTKLASRGHETFVSESVARMHEPDDTERPSQEHAEHLGGAGTDSVLGVGGDVEPAEFAEAAGGAAEGSTAETVVHSAASRPIPDWEVPPL